MIIIRTTGELIAQLDTLPRPLRFENWRLGWRDLWRNMAVIDGTAHAGICGVNKDEDALMRSYFAGLPESEKYEPVYVMVPPLPGKGL